MMAKKGCEAEALECFDFIDERNKKFITIGDLRKVFDFNTLGF